VAQNDSETATPTVVYYQQSASRHVPDLPEEPGDEPKALSDLRHVLDTPTRAAATAVSLATIADDFVPGFAPSITAAGGSADGAVGTWHWFSAHPVVPVAGRGVATEGRDAAVLGIAGGEGPTPLVTATSAGFFQAWDTGSGEELPGPGAIPASLVYDNR